jgi:Fe-S oxidoreductase
MEKIQDLKSYQEDIYTCNRTRCGFCREECPVYRITRYETFSCRGKMLVARGLMEGLLEPSKEMADMLDKCLLCG